MTREEAIKIIKNEEECVLTDCFRPSCESCNLVMETDAILTALDMAIKALEQEPSEAETQMSLPECEDVPDINVGKMDDDELDEAIRHCEEMAERGKGYAHFEYICQERRQLASWLRELKRMRAQGTCDDAVSREEALKIFDDCRNASFVWGVMKSKIIELPSVTPKYCPNCGSKNGGNHERSDS